MISRVLIFSDPELVGLLTHKVVPVAVDDWYHRRAQDAEAEFIRKVIRQEATRQDMKQSTQGRYVFLPDGRLVDFDNHGTEGLVRTKRMIRRALEEFQAAELPPLERGKADPYYDRTMPEGAVVVDITLKRLGGRVHVEDPELRKIFETALGRERLWIRRDEAAQLAAGRLPDSLKDRIVRAHLYDNTRGQHNAWWAPEDVKKAEMSLEGARLSGRVRLENAAGDRGYEAEMLGFVEARDGKLARFDLVVKGGFWEDWQTPGATREKFPLAFTFRLADPKDPAYRVPPACARSFEEYLK